MPSAMSIVELARLLHQQAQRARAGETAKELELLVTRELAADALTNLDRSSDPDELPFKPLAHHRKSGDQRPLISTGKLRAALESLRQNPDLAGGGNPFESVRQAVRYSPYHQFGTKKIPRRKFFGPGKRLRARVGRAMATWMQSWLTTSVGG